ncbi:restriction endonuclease subunit S [Acinetobacter portensis]|uniref:restriction endonuclease subunit S n=1 Tax=Acinetobacter portensis TaxID=1839785 RepID=UPI0013D7A0D4|nr:restriction endonuclease subunit S [Acinetobacter portensis]
MSYPLVCLGDIAEFINGVAFKPEDWGTEGKPIIRIQNLNNPTKEYNYTKREVRGTNIARRGDLLVSWSASLGVYEWNGQDACINQHIFKVVPNEKIDKDYLKRALELSIVEMESQVHGATMKHITRGKFLGNKIPLPPIEEQRRIASILDKAEELRQKRQQAIEKLDQLLQATFIDMFGDPVNNPKGWNKVRFEEAVEFLTGFAFKSADFKESGIKLCRGINVLPNTLDWDDTAYWDIVDVEKYSRFKIQRNDILVAMDRPWISTGFKIALVQRNDPNMLLVQRVARLRVKEDFGANFLFQILSSSEFKKHCRITETTVPHISPTDFKSFELIKPDNYLIEKFEKIAKLIHSQKAKMCNLSSEHKNLFDSLQNQAFSGNL